MAAHPSSGFFLIDRDALSSQPRKPGMNQRAIRAMLVAISVALSGCNRNDATVAQPHAQPMTQTQALPAILPRYAFTPRVEDYYPSSSRTLKEHGTARIRLCYDEQGSPDPVTLDESSGYAKLDEAALLWGKAVRITPGIYGRQPQQGCVKIPVVFSLEKSQAPPHQLEELLPPLEAPPLPVMDPPPPPPPIVPIPLAPSRSAAPMPLSSDAQQH
jgi:protein TonB